MDFNNSVILPREDFLELQTVAWDQNPPSVKERVANTTQTTVVCVVVAAAFVGASVGWAKSMDWLEERRTAREIRQFEAKNPSK